jgi:hypothetical protein
MLLIRTYQRIDEELTNVKIKIAKHEDLFGPGIPELETLYIIECYLSGRIKELKGE